MKKTIFALFAVVLVLSLATCDFLDEPLARGVDDSPVPDGKVRLAIGMEGVGAGRALTTSLASGAGGVDYYEVVFLSGTTYYQVEFGTSATDAARTIEIPPGPYNGADYAVMFAGKSNGGSDYTLLAIGIISQIGNKAGTTTPVTNGNATISPDTTSVTFKLTALKNNVSATSSASTFQILGPTNVGGSSYASSSMTNIPTITSGAITFPVFPIPKGDYSPGDSTYTYTSGSTYLVNNIVGQYNITVPFYTAVEKKANWSVTSPTYTASAPATDTAVPGTVTCHPEGGGAALSFTQISTTTNATLAFNFVVDLSATTTPFEGLCAVYIAANVCPLTTAATVLKAPSYAPGSTNTWTIRGGTVNTAPDAGNTGGAVILAIGTHFKAKMIVNPGSDPDDPPDVPWEP